MLKIQLTWWFAWIFLAIMGFSFHIDDTDKSFWDRSGMRLFTDYGTGLQYLGGPWGGVTPRLDKKGKHVSISNQEEE